MTPEELAAIKERAEAAAPGPMVTYEHGSTLGWSFDTEEGTLQFGIRGMFERREDAVFYAQAREDVPALVAEVERSKRLLLWLSAAYLDALTALRDDGDEPTTWGTHREMERIATTIAESAPGGEPFTTEQQKALEAWAAEVTL